jgi:glucose/arabinose dehydrogenase
MEPAMKKLAAFSSLLLPALLAAGEPVSDPIPEKIAKGDIRIELTDTAIGLTAPVWLTHAGDGSGRLFILDQVGIVYAVKGGRRLERPFLDVRDRLSKLNEGFDERGLLGLAFHPGFAGYRKLYTYTSEPPAPSDFPLAQGVDTNHISVVAEWQVFAHSPDAVDPATRRVVMTFGQPQMNHNGGTLLFGPDGLLYIGTGDGGAAHDLGPGHSAQGNGQDLTNPLGKVLRIDPLGRKGTAKFEGRYSIPADNPFIGRQGLDEIYAYGLRNPWRMCFDRQTGQLIAADVGQGKIEEIDIVERGGNYGWPIKEGTFFFIREGPQLGMVTRTPPTSGTPNLIDPIAQYDHDEGISITGGFVYRGKAIPALVGRYVFGDWVRPEKDAKTGRLFHADLARGRRRPGTGRAGHRFWRG